MNKPFLKKIISSSLFILFVSLWIYKFKGYFLHPSFFIDEGLYLGAAKSIVSGDLFLKSFSFDKPYLQAFLPSIGIFIAGSNSLGFRLSAIFATLIGYFLWKNLFKKIVYFENWYLTEVTAFFLTSILYLNNSFVAYTISPMAEIFIFAGLPIFYLSIFENEKTKMHYSFMFLFLIKQTVIFLPLIYFLLVPIKNFKSELLQFFRTTRWLWVFYFITLLLNKTPFSPLTFFITGLNGGAKKTNIVEITYFWLNEIFHYSQYINICMIIIVFIFSIYLFKSQTTHIKSLLQNLFQKNINQSTAHFKLTSESIYFTLLISFLFNIFIIILLKARLYPRYYLIPLSILFLLIAYYIYLTKNNKTLLKLNILFLFISFLIVFSSTTHPLLANDKIGKALQDIQYKYSDNLMIHTNLSWSIFPFRNKDQYVKQCLNESCIKEVRNRWPLLKEHIAIETDESGNDIKISEYPFAFNVSTYTDNKNLDYTKAQFLFDLKERLKLPKKAELSVIKISDDPTRYSVTVSNFLASHTLQVDGYFDFSRKLNLEYDLKKPYFLNYQPVQIGFVADYVYFNNTEITELAKLLWKSKFLFLKSLVFQESHNSKLNSVQFNLESEKINLNITSVK